MKSLTTPWCPVFTRDLLRNFHIYVKRLIIARVIESGFVIGQPISRVILTRFSQSLIKNFNISLRCNDLHGASK
jgi:hypothetical protein